MPSPSQNFTRRVYHGAPRGRADAWAALLEALAIVTGAAALFVLIGALTGGGLVALVVAQVVALAGVPVAWAIARGDAIARLGLARPRVPARALVGAALVGATLWYANVELAEPIRRAYGDRELVPIDRLIAPLPLATQLVCIAALPALCEELLVRGVLARAARPAIGAVAAVALSALLFAGLHLSVVKLVPTFVLGCVLGTLTLAADSIWPAVLAHFLNNAIALALSAGAAPWLVAALDAQPELALTASLALTALGLVISLAPRRAP